MKLKRILSGLLVTGALAGMLTAGPASAAEHTQFTDITDPKVAEAAEILRVLGIVDGTGSGGFAPEGTLDRSAFCKMTVEIMGDGDKVAAQEKRTIFRDVPSTHWANGYINVATQGVTTEETTTPGIIRGDADGNFHPNRPITYAESVTILMRVLGYGDGDVGFGTRWYDGYMSTAKGIDLLEEVSANAESPINRGQAALLFKNLLFAKMKGGEGIYFTKLEGIVKDDSVILSTSASAADGTDSSIQTSQGTYRTDRVGFSSELHGMRGEVFLDKNEKLVAFRPRKTDTYQRIALKENNANYVTGVDGVRIDVKTDIPVWKDGELTTYDQVWSGLKTGTSLVLCRNGGGKIDYIYVGDLSNRTEDTVMVLKSKPNGTSNPFGAIGGGSASLYKNGVAVTPADLRQYDVGIYDKGSNTVQISDLRLTGVYENANPNTTAPSTIKVLGKEFTVLPNAVKDLQSFQIGDSMTLLLTPDNRVAGAVTPKAAAGTAIGIASVSAGTTTVTLLDSGLELTGRNDLSANGAAALDGKLVTVSSGRKEYLTAKRLTGHGGRDPIDLIANTMGSSQLAENIRFYDSVDGGAVTAVEKKDIGLSRITPDKIAYVGKDYGGRVSVVVLDNVTGDCYDYGYLLAKSEPGPGDSVNPDGTPNTDYFEVRTIQVRRGGKDGADEYSKPIRTLENLRTGVPGGVAASGNGTLAGYVELKEIGNVSRTAFDVEEMRLTTTDHHFLISEKVQCFNKTTGKWLDAGKEGVKAAVAFADTMTVYYDKDPGEGGKIRMIVVE